jgi:hypothetical protein
VADENAGFPPEPELDLGIAPSEEATDNGGWFVIAFMGHTELTGYVTEVTLHGGVAAYHVDLPGKLWDGNPLDWQEYPASVLFSKRPVTEESVRAAWQAERERAERWNRQQAEWERQRSRPALEAGQDDAEDPYERTPF